ncbi:hypothetical protein F5Y08DRAFT_53659 [Xylaria arbuscula]|nr:hypothetical protein F5Y08DRAFT_53659 [Xylaria arbuscula]
MYGMDPVGARHVGAMLLGEVEEGSLEELLNSLRATTLTNDHDQNDPSRHHHHNAHAGPRVSEIPIPELSTMIRRHHRATQAAPSPLLSVSGRYLPFLYHLVSTLIAAPHHFAVVVVDAEGKFDVTRLVDHSHTSGSGSGALPTSSTGATTTMNEKEKTINRSSKNRNSLPASPADLTHVHIYHPRSRAREDVEAVLGQVDEYMVYGDHASRGRRWWGTVVIGGSGGGGDVNAGWKGWCRGERESVSGFALGISLEEALRERRRRHEVVERAGWVVGSPWGEYGFGGAGG